MIQGLVQEGREQDGRPWRGERVHGGREEKNGRKELEETLHGP